RQGLVRRFRDRRLRRRVRRRLEVHQVGGVGVGDTVDGVVDRGVDDGQGAGSVGGAWLLEVASVGGRHGVQGDLVPVEDYVARQEAAVLETFNAEKAWPPFFPAAWAWLSDAVPAGITRDHGNSSVQAIQQIV